jgi:signal transduction histidine kinase
LVKRIVDKHSGSIWAESEIDTGSKFYVSLPLVNPNDLVIH